MGDTFAAWQTGTDTVQADEPDLGPTSFDPPGEPTDTADTSRVGDGEDSADQESLSNALAGQVVEDDNTPAVQELTQDDARKLTNAIKTAVDVTYQLIARAHAGRAWTALGYGSWGDYVKAEFNMSRSRSYQLLDLAKVTAAIEAATPDGTDVRISESVARDIKGFLGDITDELSEQTSGLPGGEASGVVEGILDEYQERARAGTPGEETPGGAGFYDPGMGDDGAEDGYGGTGGGGGGYESNGGGGGGGTGGGTGGGGFDGAPFDPHSVRPDLHSNEPDQDELTTLERKRYLRAYDLYHALNVLADMPETDDELKDLIGRIAEDRRDRVTEQVGPACEWLARFAEEWNQQPWAKAIHAAQEAEAEALADLAPEDDYDDGYEE